MKRIGIFVFLLFALSSCFKIDPMDGFVFIPDSKNPILPAYTELGYNCFGANYDQDYFLATSGNIEVPCEISYEDNRMEFMLIGTTNDGRKDMTLSITFPLETTSEIPVLLQLHTMNIDLSNPACAVKITINGEELTLSEVSGNLHFKRVQELYVNKKFNRCILSGFFQLQFSQNGSQSKLANGRFDLGITDVWF